MAMEVITDEDWMMAVSTAPTKTSSTALLMLARNCLTDSNAAKSSIASAIIERPTNNIPNPVRMPPTCLVVLRLLNKVINAPMPAKAAKMTVVEMLLVPNIPKATNCAVTVVPMLAP